MAQDDYAILVGISVYPNPGFAKLDGPLLDIALVKDWLSRKDGGDVPEDRIQLVPSPTPYPSPVDPDEAPPTAEQFDRLFRKLLRERMALKEQRVKGRLYLYFSGHGFCSRRMNRDAEAALYSANATREYYDHIYGTQYARIAKGKALFKEVVLIMDCCRDAEVNREPTPRPYTDTPDDDLAADVPLLAIYAVPKGGKAQERPIAERGGEVHGLLTHALIKAFDEARPSRDGLLSGSELRDYLRQTWTAICGADAAPPPEVNLLGTGEILFASRNRGAPLSFRFDTPQPAGTTLSLRNGWFKRLAVLAADGDASADLFDHDIVMNLQRNGPELSLRLPPGLYEYELSSAAGQSHAFKLEGDGVHVRF